MAIELKASARDPGKPLTHFWSACIGAGRANEGLRSRWQEHMRTSIGECGFRYVRFHGLLHDDMFIYREFGGGGGDGAKGVFNFQYLDDLFDNLLDIGIRPFVELGFCPGDIATEKGTCFWWKGHGSPPKDYVKWGKIVTRLVRHCVERYGLDEVRKWYFEVWNEPNLYPFFRGTRSQYFELYKSSALAVKSVDAQLRVGGPATSNFVPDARFDGEKEDTSCHKTVTHARDLDALEWRPVWLAQFFDFCRREKLPIDFVSVHPYPTDWALDEHGTGKGYTRGVNATRDDLRMVRRLVNESPFPKAEIHLTEWSSSSSPRDFSHDYLPAAAYVVRANLDSIGLVDSLSYWTFTDVFEEGGAGHTIFHGGFGLINYQGIVKPTFHAYRFLHALGDELLLAKPGAVVTRHRATGRLTALLCHYPSELPQTVPTARESRPAAEEIEAIGTPGKLTIELTGLPPGAPILVETLCRHRGHAIDAWTAMGQPEPPSREQTNLLRQAARDTLRETLRADATGRFVLDRSVEPWNVILIKQL